MWSIVGALSIISFLVSPVGQKIIEPVLTGQEKTSMIVGEITDLNELR